MISVGISFDSFLWHSTTYMHIRTMKHSYTTYMHMCTMKHSYTSYMHMHTMKHSY